MFDPTLFLASLRELLKDDVASLAYTDEELCFLANYECPPEDQLPYDDYDAFIQQLTEKGKAAVAKLPNYDSFFQVYQLLAYEKLKQHGIAVKAIVQMEPNGRNLKWLLDRKDKQERQKRLDRKRLQSIKKEEVIDQPLPEVTVLTHEPETIAETAPAPDTKVELPLEVEPAIEEQPIKVPNKQPRAVRRKKRRRFTGVPYTANVPSFKIEVSDKFKSKTGLGEKLRPLVLRYMR